MSNKQDDPNVKTRSKLKIISILLFVVGIPLVIAGAIAFGYLSANFFSLSFEESAQLSTMAFGMLVPGAFLSIIGLFLTIVAHQRNITRYAFEETGMALGGASEKALDGYGRVISKGSEAMASGIRNAGGLKFDVSKSGEQKIMIKCTLCGTLNDEEAAFCDNCGEKI
ncbi:MAG: zinc ribbon domain-containing protein [Candidatus Lokiarchaeota archaeon]|nr:zinc ribbon domain-containing protein [Candidatus Lokiarchaeota archaeon]